MDSVELANRVEDEFARLFADYCDMVISRSTNPPDLWTVADGNPHLSFTVPNDCAHANENQAQHRRRTCGKIKGTMNEHGRNFGFRFWFSQGSGGSSPLIRTNKILKQLL